MKKLGLLWRLSKGYRLRPWASPYLRWRMETYSGVHAQQLTFSSFWAEIWKWRDPFGRYLDWAADMPGRLQTRQTNRHKRSTPDF